MSKHKIVVVGGGFGGVKMALSLVGDHRFQVTLISDHPDFRYYPTLFRTATGGQRAISSIALTEIFNAKAVRVMLDSAKSINREAKTVLTTKGEHLPYDALVLAMGTRTNYFHIKGLQQYSYGIKSVDEAEELKHHLHQQLLDDRKPDLNYVVIGGGPTGIELAGALPGYIHKITKQHHLPDRPVHVDLVEAAPRLVPRLPRDVSARLARQLRHLGITLYLNTAVQAETVDTLMVNNKPIRSHTVIWTAGVTNHPFFADQGFQLAKDGRVRVDQYLQAEPGIYVLGDNADTPYSGMAQTALNDARFVAHNMQRLASNRDPLPYTAKRPVYVLPAGPSWAAVLWGPLRIYGWVGWSLRLLADLIAYRDYEPWRLASKHWVAEANDEEECPICASNEVA